MIKLFDHDPKLKWVFCLTHPDDEISIAGFIRRLVLNGNEVYMTWTHHTPHRADEARQAASWLGLGEDRLRFLHGQDRHICDQLTELKPEFQSLFEELRPDRVVCGAFEQGHLDHDSTNWIISQTFNGPILEVPFYHTYASRLQVMNRFSDPRGAAELLLEPDEQRVKQAIARMYPSQNIWSVLFWHEVWTAIQFKRAHLYRRELLRLKTNFDFTQPDHPPLIAERVRASASWQRWIAALERQT